MNIAWVNQLISIRIENPQSNARNMSQQTIDEEVERMLYFYNRRTEHGLMYYLRRKSGLMQTLKKPLTPLKKAFRRLRQDEASNLGGREIATQFVPTPGADTLAEAFRLCDDFMTRYNADRPVEFLYPTATTA